MEGNTTYTTTPSLNERKKEKKRACSKASVRHSFIYWRRTKAAIMQLVQDRLKGADSEECFAGFSDDCHLQPRLKSSDASCTVNLSYYRQHG